MHNIIFISITHNENGNCNGNELCKIIEKINPEIIFLEALCETYSNYQGHLFSEFGIYHKKLEINAIQKYNYISTFEYIPVLDFGLSDAFEKKYNLVCETKELQEKLENFNTSASKRGFQFLNSDESIELQENTRILENNILNNSQLNKNAIESINAYENSMLRNIYSYCKKTEFNKAIFMCGIAHRKSIIEKIDKYI
ncbi:hypothetical protein [Chryseobacterium gambrini]|uniref:TraB family protein n=1 Tax=Chryseobacterium gambrini TaxID=373672 RepID=A0A1N7KQJ4_9FLAO|nr:hypothetical protein [Chryseobacterium gambrini]SIS63776.1 hypothetical protein SAMN05421785_101660 [Chryseobacterium gambrini]